MGNYRYLVEDDKELKILQEGMSELEKAVMVEVTQGAKVFVESGYAPDEKRNSIYITPESGKINDVVVRKDSSDKYNAVIISAGRDFVQLSIRKTDYRIRRDAPKSS